MKPLVNTLIKHLDTLISLIESVDSLTWYKSELQELGKKLEKSRKPFVPSRSLWNRYIRVYSTIEELINIIKTKKEPVHLYQILPSIREEIIEFINSLEKSYLAERVQMSLPIMLCLIVTLIRLFNNLSQYVLFSFILSISALILVFYTPRLGLIVNSIASLLIAIRGTNANDIFLGSLLFVVSVTYMSLVQFARSGKFTMRIEEFVKSISWSIREELKEKPLLSNEKLECLIKKYSVDTSSFLKQGNYEDLVKYKAVLIIIHGLSTCTSSKSTTLISTQSNSEKVKN